MKSQTIKSPQDAITAVSGRLEGRGVTIYRLHKETGVNERSLRYTLNEAEDVKVSTLLAMLEKLGGQLVIKWD